MSASDKKKLRKEQATNMLTERQRQEQAEAKKLKAYTITFTAIMICIVVAVLGVLAVRTVNNSGVIQKNTLAATIGDKELNSVEFSYYYTDAINDTYSEWYSQYDSYTDDYLKVMGLDTTKPLDEQINPDTEASWAQFFIDAALTQAKEDFALYNKAVEEKFELPEDEQKSLDNMLKNIETYAALYGYSNANQYLRANYGYGAELESYSEYLTRSTIATAFYKAHEENLTYKDEDIREYDDKDPIKFNSYSYSNCYLSYTEFLQGGTKGEDGKTTYTEEENAAARKALKEAADKLAAAKDVEEMKELAETIEVNASGQVAVNDFTNKLYSGISSPIKEWLADENRKIGDIEAVPNTSTTTDEDGKEITEINGYYILVYQGINDNTKLMSNVRHLLVKFEGGTTDESTGETTYTDKEKAAAKEKAEGYLKTYLEGKKDEDSFIELVKKYSKDSSASEGGLFEDIHYNSNYVANFKNWAVDAKRKAGDTEVIETEYGYHVMYYVGDSDTTYRDMMITDEMRTNDQDEWFEALSKPVTAKEGDTSKLKLDLVLSGN